MKKQMMYKVFGIFLAMFVFFRLVPENTINALADSDDDNNESSYVTEFNDDDDSDDVNDSEKDNIPVTGNNGVVTTSVTISLYTMLCATVLQILKKRTV